VHCGVLALEALIGRAGDSMLSCLFMGYFVNAPYTFLSVLAYLSALTLSEVPIMALT